MSKIGYYLAGIFLLAMLWYLFAQGDEGRDVHIFTETLPDEFSITMPDWRQTVSGNTESGFTLTINDIPRPLLTGKVQRLRKFLKRIRVPSDSVIPEVALSDLAVYGISEAYELRFADQRYRWGVSDHSGYMWSESSGDVYIMSEKAIAGLNGYCKRFDEQTLVAGLNQLRSIDTGTVKLVRLSKYGGWLSEGEIDRPAFNSRGNMFVGFLKSFRFVSLSDVDHDGADEVQRLTVDMLDGSQHVYRFLERVREQEGEPEEQREEQRESTYFLAVDELPVQNLARSAWQALQYHLEQLDEDYLFDFAMGMEGLPFDRIIIKHGNVEAYRLQRYGNQDESLDIHGYSYWSILWSGGSEAANSEAGARFYSLFNHMPVRNVRLADSPIPSDPSVVTIQLMDGEKKVLAQMYWHKDATVQSPYHSATIDEEYAQDMPITYEQLFDPASFLNPYVLPADMRRIDKIQRLYYTEKDLGYQGELLVKQSQSSWQRHLYTKIGDQGRSKNADGMACLRLATHVVDLKALAVKLVSAENIGDMENPQRGFDIRLAAWGDQRGDDDQLLEETLARDWGLSFKQRDSEEGPQWWAMNRAQTVMYHVSDEDVARLFGGIQDTYIFSGVVSHVNAIEVRMSDDAYVLQRIGRAWGIVVDAHQHTVEDLSIRSFLKSLSELRAVKIHENAPVISAQTADVIMTISLPGIDEVTENISLFIAGVNDSDSQMIRVSAHASNGHHPFSGVALVDRKKLVTIIRKHAFFMSAENQEQHQGQHQHHDHHVDEGAQP